MKFFVSVFMLGLTLCFSVANAGGISSGGGSIMLQDLNPWYLDHVEHIDTIGYCVEVDEKSFSVAPSKLKRLTRLALNAWFEILNISHIRPLILGGESSHYTIARSFSEARKNTECTVTFKFGVKDDLVKKELKRRPALTLAFSHQQRQDESFSLAMRDPGMVWFAPDLDPESPIAKVLKVNKWDEEQILFILLHELGHVFGLGHIPHTIMSESYMTYVMSGLEDFKKSDKFKKSKYSSYWFGLEHLQKIALGPWFENINQYKSANVQLEAEMSGWEISRLVEGDNQAPSVIESFLKSVRMLRDKKGNIKSPFFTIKSDLADANTLRFEPLKTMKDEGIQGFVFKDHSFMSPSFSKATPLFAREFGAAVGVYPTSSKKKSTKYEDSNEHICFGEGDEKDCYVAHSFFSAGIASGDRYLGEATFGDQKLLMHFSMDSDYGLSATIMEGRHYLALTFSDLTINTVGLKEVNKAILSIEKGRD